jgi:tRNA 2-thiouridine synthesizing protein E
MELIVEGNILKTTEEGFLIDLNDWSEAVAIDISRLDEIELSRQHWEIIFFIRHYYQTFKHLPNTRVFIQAIKKKWGEEIGNSRHLHKLFPQGPLKYACKIAGLPKPPTCL